VLPAPLTFDAVRDRLAAVLRERAPRPLEVPGYRRAAVLALLLAREAGPTVLFTVRANTLPHHRGEISFPGGGLAPGESAEQGALREAEEEVGLSPGTVELLGRLDDLVSVAGFLVTPVVGAVRAPPAAFVPAPGEVDEPFELPLARLFDPALRRVSLWDPARLPPEVAQVVRRANLPAEDVDPASGHWRVWSFHADEARVVWGLTGRVLKQLLEVAGPFGAAPTDDQGA
jgi:8-oxo-dGTP pyrophosphatase MutT (NUDIX family)